MNQNFQLVLASQSPRRRQLLEQAGYRFGVNAPSDAVEAGICSSCSPEEFVTEAALKKAQAFALQLKQSEPEARDAERTLVLAADTVAECKAQILGKPRDVDHAEAMLRLMEGQLHRVLTGVCLWDLKTDKFIVKLEQTSLQMSSWTEEKLQTYLESDEWIGKAGAFGYQDGLDWVQIIEGLESNVVGLPVERLPEWIKLLHEKTSLV